eukprot:CAMPEP_0177227678 /NCGR_PEP_ID=MMETSP0367-20130122/40748_1 /TAXON_ID=447022 ORGANISM="Scrippsiella hangoei-like, Strain SHHI-4" /NCGR_SAMPLE_ID=MMETSP0367 /ASSEMBLY_ACC=CAM_ASM_000362 /LENGTH=232 /DNA_ID=CAMNT_0018677935 /DNA_START=59 /DNA_END=756 /DNA_ORIENTATION=+
MTRDLFLGELEKRGEMAAIDFVYVCVSLDDKRCTGQAYMNFVLEPSAIDFRDRWHGKKDVAGVACNKSNKKTKLNVEWAHHHGFEALREAEQAQAHQQHESVGAKLARVGPKAIRRNAEGAHSPGRRPAGGAGPGRGVVEAVLKYAYTCEFEFDDAAAVLGLADRYDMSSLVSLCPQQMIEGVTAENVAKRASTMNVYFEHEQVAKVWPKFKLMRSTFDMIEVASVFLTASR